MEIALDKNGKRIDAWELNANDRVEEYFCPICHKPVILRAGEIKINHFAHRAGECEDDWHYDMSEWHFRMQSYFPVNTREIVIKTGRKTHRADILIEEKKTVIEFQHSPLTAEEFEDRNSFFMRQGYRIAWVFDISRIFSEERFVVYRENTFHWKWPIKLASVAPRITDHNEMFSLWLYMGWEDDEESEIHKVIWTDTDDDGFQTLGRFSCARRTLILNRKPNTDYLFWMKGQGIQSEFKKAISNLKECAAVRIKYVGEKGHNPECYKCPQKEGKFGVDLYGANSCSYCKYCGLIAHTNQGKKRWAIYCCYPTAVRPIVNPYDSEYECNSIEQYLL